MSDNQLSSFYLVYKSSQSFWSNYGKACSWLKVQGFKPVNGPFKCPVESSEIGGNDNVSGSNCHQINQEDDESDSFSGYSPDEENDDSTSETTVDEDYIKFILETRKHQKERAQLKAERIKMEENEEIIYKDICEIDQQRLIGIPFEQQSGRSQSDYNHLYGIGSETIKAKETLLQSDFNVFCDTHKPPFWPTIPIKI